MSNFNCRSIRSERHK